MRQISPNPLPFAKKVFYLVKQTIICYDRDRVFHMGAAMSYYTIFSLPAIIIISISMAGVFFSSETVSGEIFEIMRAILGEASALQIKEVITKMGESEQNGWKALVGFIVLLFGATGVFTALQNALNTIFGVKSLIKKNLIRIITYKVLTFGMVLAVSFIVLVSLVLNTMLRSFATYITNNKVFKDYSPEWFSVFESSGIFVWKNVLTFAAFFLFFAMIFRVLPEVKLRWKHIWGGALVTTVLFSVGELLLGVFLANTRMWTAYGAAGSVVVILIWVYFSAQMVFIGAEFIKVYCQYRGYEIEPKDYAIKVRFKGMRRKKKKAAENEDGE